MVRFGIQLPQMAYPSIKYADLKELAILAEKLGYDAISIGDRTLIDGQDRDKWGRMGLSGSHLNCMTTLASFASVTRRMTLMTNIFAVPLRHPAEIADMVATLDVISGGRFILIAGVGGYSHEYAALGLPWEERGRIMEESIQVMKALWTQDEVTFKGRYFNFEKETLASPKPIQKPHPPVWIGTPKMLRRVVRFVSGWTGGGGSVEIFRQNMRIIREEAKKIGRDPDEIRKQVMFQMAIDKDDATARKIAADIAGKKYFEGSRPATEEKLAEVGLPISAGTDRRDSPSSGSPERCAAYIKQFTELGATDITIHFIPYSPAEIARSMVLFASEVIPRLK